MNNVCFTTAKDGKELNQCLDANSKRYNVRMNKILKLTFPVCLFTQTLPLSQPLPHDEHLNHPYLRASFPLDAILITAISNEDSIRNKLETTITYPQFDLEVRSLFSSGQEIQLS